MTMNQIHTSLFFNSFSSFFAAVSSLFDSSNRTCISSNSASCSDSFRINVTSASFNFLSRSLFTFSISSILSSAVIDMTDVIELRSITSPNADSTASSSSSESSLPEPGMGSVLTPSLYESYVALERSSAWGGEPLLRSLVGDSKGSLNELLRD